MKFGLSSDWQPIKFDVAVDMPEVLDLSSMKGCGLQPHEEEMPDSLPESAAMASDQGILILELLFFFVLYDLFFTFLEICFRHRPRYHQFASLFVRSIGKVERYLLFSLLY